MEFALSRTLSPMLITIYKVRNIMTERKYEFTWELLGDITLARPNLGPLTRLEVYRLFQYTLRDVLEAELGTEQTDRMFYKAGQLAARHFYTNLVGTPKDLAEFVATLQTLLRDLKIGILRVEKADLATGSFVLTVHEDLDCSGLPDLGHQVCVYDEGFIAGLLERFSGREYLVKEIDCWCTGERTCRFSAELVS
jgi:predicted hydrocarbon binding protein